MSQVRARIDAGACGFTTDATATCDDGQHVTLAVTSTCEKVQGLGERLTEVDSYNEITEGAEGALLRAAREHLTGCCAGCVVPSGLFKAMQASAGLALPSPIRIELERV